VFPVLVGLSASAEENGSLALDPPQGGAYSTVSFVGSLQCPTERPERVLLINPQGERPTPQSGNDATEFATYAGHAYEETPGSTTAPELRRKWTSEVRNKDVGYWDYLPEGVYDVAVACGEESAEFATVLVTTVDGLPVTTPWITLQWSNLELSPVGGSDPDPTDSPSPEPTDSPTPDPTESPSPDPTDSPSPDPTDSPSPEPTEPPTPSPDPSDVPPGPGPDQPPAANAPFTALTDWVSSVPIPGGSAGLAGAAVLGAAALVLAWQVRGAHRAR